MARRRQHTAGWGYEYESTGHGSEEEADGMAAHHLAWMASELSEDAEGSVEDGQSYVHFMGALWDYSDVFRDWRVGERRDELGIQPWNAIAA